MSTIVVVRKNGQACIAADTLTSFGETRYGATYKSEADKIMQVGDTYIGLIGSPAHRQVLESVFGADPAALRAGNRKEIFESFRALHPVLKEKYFLNPQEEKEPYESIQLDLLLANPHGIFYLSTLRDVYEFSRFWAIGSGGDFALGALHALYDSALDARQIAEAAVRAACEFDNASAMPLTSGVVTLA